MRALLIALALALSLAGPAAASEPVPFRGTLEGVATITPLGPTAVSVRIEGAGYATQLGRYTLQVPHVVNPQTRIASGSYVFTAANGDTLTATFTGQATPTATPGVLTIEETATITGGTGRFSDATGTFTARRVFNQLTGVTTGSFEGRISSPGA
jgi:hypothetical protein